MTAIAWRRRTFAGRSRWRRCPAIAARRVGGICSRPRRCAAGADSQRWRRSSVGMSSQRRRHSSVESSSHSRSPVPGSEPLGGRSDPGGGVGDGAPGREATFARRRWRRGGRSRGRRLLRARGLVGTRRLVGTLGLVAARRLVAAGRPSSPRSPSALPLAPLEPELAQLLLVDRAPGRRSADRRPRLSSGRRSRRGSSRRREAARPCGRGRRRCRRAAARRSGTPRAGIRSGPPLPGRDPERGEHRRCSSRVADTDRAAADLDPFQTTS